MNYFQILNPEILEKKTSWVYVSPISYTYYRNTCRGNGYHWDCVFDYSTDNGSGLSRVNRYPS